MDWTAVQTKLGCEADGKPGPLTYTARLAYLAGRPPQMLGTLGAAAAKHIPEYGIASNASRLANFLGQGCHETEGFRYLREIWGPTVAQKGYEGRKDLGNVYPGDGFRYMGRGVFQVTGRANYASMGQRIGIELEENPGIVETPDIAMWTACEYWKSRGLSDLADTGQDDTITRRINGGTNGIDKRRALVARAKAILS